MKGAVGVSAAAVILTSDDSRIVDCLCQCGMTDVVRIGDRSLEHTIGIPLKAFLNVSLLSHEKYRADNGPAIIDPICEVSLIGTKGTENACRL